MAFFFLAPIPHPIYNIVAKAEYGAFGNSEMTLKNAPDAFKSAR